MRRSAFIDEVEITVVGGRGGDGMISFLRERARPHGGPNGGDGGHGGSVLAIATTALNTLSEYRFRRRIVAANGERGGGKDRHGKNGGDTVLEMPLGTRIFDAETGDLHADLTAAEEPVLLSAGGRGGFGNAHFKTSVNRAPRRFTPGETSVERHFRLELSVLADVGLLGAPNVGKSTLLRAISSARPKVADYPFTTLAPQLGVVRFEDGHDSAVVADIPGLLDGAAEGVGLGNRFLRHLSRTALLWQVADISSPTLAEDCLAIGRELAAADLGELKTKPRWLILNKTDLLSSAEDIENRRRQMSEDFPHFSVVLALSAQTGDGTKDAMRRLLAEVCAKK